VPSPFIGKPAPPFTLPQLADPARTLGAAELKGRVWVLNVWASWCAPCRDEHPLLVEVARRQQLTLVGLNYKDDRRNAQEWLRRLGDPYSTTVVDADGRVSIDYGVYGVPESFVIDRDGVVRLKHVGPLTREVWQRDFEPLLRRLQG
jgi:cytochrome c biogenesis protein CcmG/thiol:disulfide interchange protein DsbE